MSSLNYLTVKSALSEFRTGSDKDTASESGTTTSVTSADELQKFALILGFNSVEDVYQEKFRIDRRRLEIMLADSLEEAQTAHAFFNRIMDETNTLIKWPTRLKIGARSKKDPHVRVAGRVENVKLAREKIMQLLDTRSNRVTMKIDVSYTDHSHIIGKGGLTIKRVMEETGCHIHFPDSNRTSAVEKSNQVSIAGDMERVERARARVRALTPLVFSFELPIVAGSPQQLDVNAPAIQRIQEQYNVQVMIRNRSKLHSNLMVVKGVQWEVQATMEATTMLMNYMCGNLASQTKVQMSMEISAMHHGVVVGQGASQLRGIMKATNTQIMFPDADDPNIPAIKKSCVTITGQIRNVYAARQQLIGSLPLVVIFDVPEDTCHIDQDVANSLMAKHKVLISVRRKTKQGIASVVMKGIERNAAELYEARRELLGGTEQSIAAEIPESYNVTFATNTMPNFTQFNPFSPQHNSPGLGSPYMPTIIDVNYASPGMNAGNNCYVSPVSPVGAPLYSGGWCPPSPPVPYAPYHSTTSYHGAWNPLNGGEGPNSLQPNYLPMHQVESKPLTLNQILSCSTNSSSGYQSTFSSCASLEVHNTTGGGSSNLGSPSVSPISKATSTSPAHDNDRSQQELANIIQETPISERKAPGCELKTLVNKMSPKSDYRKLKAEANKAMQAEIGAGYRVPNTRWSGYYFSHTSPGPLTLNEGTPDNDTPAGAWSPALGRPNIALPASPPCPPCQANRPCKYEELYELLTHLSLHKYIDLFKKHELDLNTFATLSEDDLITMGVTAMGARKKMLMMMKEVKLVKQRDFHEDMKSFKDKLRNMMDQM